MTGVHPGPAAMVSARSALLSSFEEVRQVLLEQGIVPGVKVIRKPACRFADRARALQQAGHIPLSNDEIFMGEE